MGCGDSKAVEAASPAPAAPGPAYPKPTSLPQNPAKSASADSEEPTPRYDENDDAEPKPKQQNDENEKSSARQQPHSNTVGTTSDGAGSVLPSSQQMQVTATPIVANQVNREPEWTQSSRVSFDPVVRRGYIAAAMSELIKRYTPDMTTSDNILSLDKWGLLPSVKIHHFHAEHKTSRAAQWIIARCPEPEECFILAFRGCDASVDALIDNLFVATHHGENGEDTDSDSEIGYDGDGIVEIRAAAIDSMMPHGIYIHSNVVYGLAASSDLLEKEIKKAAMEFPSLPWILTGHSFGGAIATLAAGVLSQDILSTSSVFTFGAPLLAYSDPGVPHTAGKLQPLPSLNRCFNMVNRNDIVPRFLGSACPGGQYACALSPPLEESLVEHGRLLSSGLYFPVGTYVSVDSQSDSSRWKSTATNELDINSTILKPPPTSELASSIQDGAAVNYLRAARAVAVDN